MMKKVLLLLFLWMVGCSKPPQSFVLIGHDVPCTVVLNLGPYDSALEASRAVFNGPSTIADSLLDISRNALCALELRNHLARIVEMRESRIPIYDENDPVPEGVVIHIGLPSDRKEYKSVRRALERRWNEVSPQTIQTFRLDSFVEDKRTILVLSGISSIGTLYAGYELLQQIGVRWFFPGEEGTKLPRQYEIQLPGLKLAVHPDFDYRGYQKWHSVDMEADSAFCLWLIRNRFNVFPQQKKYTSFLARGGIHAIVDVHSIYEQTTARIADVDSDHGFCVSDEHWKNTFESVVRAVFDSVRCSAIGLWPPDIWCQCSECSRLSAAEKYATVVRFLTHPSPTDRNYKPKHLYINFPSDYFDSFQAFENLITDENTTILFYNGPRCYNHYSIDPHCININYPFANRCMQFFKQTNRKMGVNELFNAEYMGELVTAFPSVMRLDIPAYRELGVKALLYMNPRINDAGIQQLVHYQYAQQTWNSSVAIDSVNTEYFRHCYGPIAPIMKQYYLYMEASLQAITTWLYYLPRQLDTGWTERDTTVIRNEKYQPAGERDVNFNKVWEKSYYNIYQARFLLNKAFENELPESMKRQMDLHERHLRHAELVMNMMDGIVLYTTLGPNEPEMRQEALLQIKQYADQLKQYNLEFPLFGTPNAFRTLHLDHLVERFEDVLRKR